MIGDLTDREREILVLSSRFMSNQEIANYLGIASKTVSFHKARAYPKLGVHTIEEAIRALGLDTKSAILSDDVGNINTKMLEIEAEQRRLKREVVALRQRVERHRIELFP